MKFYITKYALTQGILEKEGELVDSIKIGEKFLRVRNKSPYTDEYYHGNDFHESLIDAQILANNIVLRKIESLKKQITKLEKLKF
jgi:hypothetical protein